MPSQPIFRFAPSPNGYLHIGHAYSALFTQRAAMAVGGTVLLRIEDIDPQRSKPEFDAAILDDLEWLGFLWSGPVLRQSSRYEVYGKAIEKLRHADLLYPCFCSRAQVAAEAAETDPEGSPVYPGTCRHLAADAAAEKLATAAPVQWRLKMDEAMEEIGDVLAIRECPVTDRDVLFAEERHRAADPGRWGDVVLVRKEAPTSYHLSVVVDDAEQRVTHVTRGMDLHLATDIHVLLQALLGLPSPIYAHHGLMTDSLSAKLSKSAGAPALRDFREAGWSTADVRRRIGLD